MKRFLAKLPQHSTILVDSAPLIYWLEDHRLARRFAPLFAAIDDGRFRLAITAITLTEVLTGPIKAGKEALAQRYVAALSQEQGIAVLPVDAALALPIARLRIRYALKVPDACQVAAALHYNCAALVTHDRDFRQVDDLPVYS